METLKTQLEENLAKKENLDGIHQRMTSSKGIANADRNVVLDLLSKEIESLNWAIIGIEREIDEIKHLEGFKNEK
jgi:hypothetical protein